jgi:hypothetical protein
LPSLITAQHSVPRIPQRKSITKGKMYLARKSTDSDFDKALSGTINRGAVFLIVGLAHLTFSILIECMCTSQHWAWLLRRIGVRSMQFHLLSPEPFNSVATMCTCTDTQHKASYGKSQTLCLHRHHPHHLRYLLFNHWGSTRLVSLNSWYIIRLYRCPASNFDNLLKQSSALRPLEKRCEPAMVALIVIVVFLILAFTGVAYYKFL